MNAPIYLAIAGGVGAGYILFRRRLDDYVLPMREEMAEFGEQLIADPDVSPSIRDRIRANLDFAFSPWPMLAALVLLPVAMFMLVVGFRPDIPKMAKDVMDDVNRFDWMVARSWAAANPIVAIILLAELIILIPPFIILHRANKSLTDALDIALSVWADQFVKHNGHAERV